MAIARIFFFATLSAIAAGCAFLLVVCGYVVWKKMVEKSRELVGSLDKGNDKEDFHEE